MVKIQINARVDEEIIEELDRIAEIRHKGVRTDAVEAAIKQYVALVGRCSRCGAICQDVTKYCPECGAALSLDAKAVLFEMLKDVADHPEVLRDALNKYIQEREQSDAG